MARIRQRKRAPRTAAGRPSRLIRSPDSGPPTQPLAATGIVAEEQAGQSAVVPGAVAASPTGLPPPEAVGTVSVATVIPAQTVATGGIVSGEMAGVAGLFRTVAPAGIRSSEVLGRAVAALTLAPVGIPSSERAGVNAVTPGAVTLGIAGIPSGEASGRTALGPLILTAGIPTDASVGQAVVELPPAPVADGEGVHTLTHAPAAPHILTHNEPGVVAGAGMATLGPSVPGTFVGAIGVAVAWVNPANVAASDNVYMTASLDAAAPPLDHSDRVHLTNFTPSLVLPVGAFVDGVQVDIERKASNTLEVQDRLVQLLSNSLLVGTSKASAATWPNADAIATYGGAADTWGLDFTTITIDSTFGVALSVQAVGAGVVVASVDRVQMTVTYHVEAQPPRSRTHLLSHAPVAAHTLTHGGA